MRKNRYIAPIVMIILLGTVWFSYSVAEDYLRAKFIGANAAEKRWGQKTFNAVAFKKGSAAVRAPMAVDALKKQLYKGEDVGKVRQALGDPDGYFFSDTILAYQIDEYTDEKKEAWQVVFIPDVKSGTISSIKIHQKCCYEEPPWARE